MAKKRYFEELPIRNLVEFKKGKYTLYSYDDKMVGVWLGNINVYKDDNMVLHATLQRAYTKEELEKYADDFIKDPIQGIECFKE